MSAWTAGPRSERSMDGEGTRFHRRDSRRDAGWSAPTGWYRPRRPHARHLHPRLRPANRPARVRPAPRDGGISVFYSNPADAAIDADTLQTLIDSYGERAKKL